MDKGTILVVEDHKDISDMLAAFLAEHGYEVECAYDGREASAFLKEKSYTIILMDLMLPYKSGVCKVGNRDTVRGVKNGSR